MAEWIELFFWHRGYPCIIVHSIKSEFGYLQKRGYFPRIV